MQNKQENCCVGVVNMGEKRKHDRKGVGNTITSQFIFNREAWLKRVRKREENANKE